ncbi:flagellin [Candidatus Neomarinimicrobiota bacterium]
MRVTNSIIREQIINSLTNNQTNLFQIQEQISSAKEVAKSSDDPTRFNRASRFKSLLSKNEQYLENIEDGLGWNNTSSDALDIVFDALVEVKEIALQSRSDSDPITRPQMAGTVDALLQEMILIANTKFLGKYIFGGSITKDIEPFSFDGSAITYNGNTDDITRKVGENAFLEINIVGSEFQDALQATLAIRDALASNDGVAIDAALALEEDSELALLSTISRGGSGERKLTITRSNLELIQLNLKTAISQAEDVDMTEAVLKFNAQELGLRAALESSNRMMNITILDYLPIR